MTSRGSSRGGRQPAAAPVAITEPFAAQESPGEPALSRDELRRLILAELREVVRA